MNCFLNFRLRSKQMRLNLLRHASILVLSIGCLLFQPANLVAQIGNIFGGTPIDISDAPYQVSVELNGGHGCGGAIINSEWVLSAGHCYDGVQPGNLMVHAGATDQTNNNIGQRVEVDQIIFHPDYAPFSGLTVATHDLALLHLSTPLCFNENVQPVVFATPANTSPDDVAPGTATFITGWGDLDVPASNCFTNPGTQVDILTAGQWGGTTDFFTYYHQYSEPPVDCDPEPLNPGNYGKHDVPGTYTVDCSKFGGLPEGLESPTDGDLNTKRQQLQTLAPNIQTDVNAKVQYYQVLAEKEAILKYLVSEALEEEDFATVEALLAGEEGKAAQWAIFGLRMDRQDYAGAAQLLNQFPVGDVTDTQFRDIQLINLQRLQNPANFELSAAQEAYLNSVADGYSPIRGYARGILGLLKDRVYFPDEYDFTEERSNPVERIATGALKVYPVPARDQLGRDLAQHAGKRRCSTSGFRPVGTLATVRITWCKGNCPDAPCGQPAQWRLLSDCQRQRQSGAPRKIHCSTLNIHPPAVRNPSAPPIIFSRYGTH